MKKAKDWFPNDKATHEWLDSQKKSSRATYQTNWKYFLEYTGLTGDQILEDRKQDIEHRWEKKVLAFKQWLMDKKKQGEYTATAASATVRGFFAFHYTPLKYRPPESQKLKERRRKTEDYYFSKEDLKKMVDVADLKEKYVIVAGKSFGLRASDFMRLTRGNLEPYLQREPPISLGEFPTKKEGVSAYPFIDSDALPVIKLMIEQMDREGRRDPADKILPWKSQIELTNVLQRVAKRAGLNIGNKIVRFHCLRKFLIDRISRFMSESKWKQIVGKTISEGAYVSPDSLREDYMRAMDETTFTRTISENEIELRAGQRSLEMILNLSTTMPEHIKEQLRKKIRAVRKLEELKTVQDEITEQSKTQTNGGCPNGHHCGEQFEQVKESDLLSYLRQGWQLVHKLANGEVIVKR